MGRVCTPVMFFCTGKISLADWLLRCQSYHSLDLIRVDVHRKHRLEPELDRQVEQLRSCEADLKVATEMIAHGTECLRDLAACKQAQGDASQ
jgi:hypothetical protein